MSVALGFFLFWLFCEYLECKPIYDEIKKDQKLLEENPNEYWEKIIRKENQSNRI